MHAPYLIVPNLAHFMDASSDCDCACELTLPDVQAVQPPSARWQTWPLHGLLPVNNAGDAVVIFAQGTLSAVVANAPAQQILHAFNTPVTLQQARKQVEGITWPAFEQIARAMQQAGLLQPCDAPTPAMTGESVLSAWLHVTDRCNLRCDYCYLPHVREDMTDETGLQVLETIFRSAVQHGFKKVKLKYAGGEPLLRLDFVLRLHDAARRLSQQNDISLQGIVLSNGTLLTSEKARLLVNSGLRLMISLDGLGHYHDAHRRYVSGRGSFQEVAQAVERAQDSGLPLTLSVTISSRTVEGLPDLVGWIVARDIPFSLNFYRENDRSMGFEDLQLDDEKIIRGVQKAFEVIESNLPRRTLLGGLLDRANLSAMHEYTCGVGRNYLVFNQHGQVAKCQMLIRNPITDLSDTDPLRTLQTDQKGIQNLPVLAKEGCQTCEWRHWCAGGCPVATFRAAGRYDTRSPYCNIYKALFPAVFRLEGLRLLRYQNEPQVTNALV